MAHGEEPQQLTVPSPVTAHPPMPSTLNERTSARPSSGAGAGRVFQGPVAKLPGVVGAPTENGAVVAQVACAVGRELHVAHVLGHERRLGDRLPFARPEERPPAKELAAFGARADGVELAASDPLYVGEPRQVVRRFLTGSPALDGLGIGDRAGGDGVGTRSAIGRAEGAGGAAGGTRSAHAANARTARTPETPSLAEHPIARVYAASPWRFRR